jgi:hypothetical protein
MLVRRQVSGIRWRLPRSGQTNQIPGRLNVRIGGGEVPIAGAARSSYTVRVRREMLVRWQVSGIRWRLPRSGQTNQIPGCLNVRIGGGDVPIAGAARNACPSAHLDGARRPYYLAPALNSRK